VRLPDELVAFVDEVVDSGGATPRSLLALVLIRGLLSPSVVSCDNVTTIPTSALRAQVGVLLDRQEPALSAAIRMAFDLD
jgi:mRNA-degrading endonuclease toxin of MazEF toxin-antitoxin module